MLMSTFLESVNPSGKRLLPFVTYATSGEGATASTYRALHTGARLGKVLAVGGEEAQGA